MPSGALPPPLCRRRAPRLCRGHPREGCASSGLSGRPRAASRAPRPLGRGAQTALLDGQPRCGNHTRLNSEGAASFAVYTHLAIGACGKVAARGRAASPTSGGGIVKCHRHLLVCGFEQRVQITGTGLVPSDNGRVWHRRQPTIKPQGGLWFPQAVGRPLSLFLF
jgi:hypothetical protein